MGILSFLKKSARKTSPGCDAPVLPTYIADDEILSRRRSPEDIVYGDGDDNDEEPAPAPGVPRYKNDITSATTSRPSTALGTNRSPSRLTGQVPPAATNECKKKPPLSLGIVRLSRTTSHRSRPGSSRSQQEGTTTPTLFSSAPASATNTSFVTTTSNSYRPFYEAPAAAPPRNALAGRYKDILDAQGEIRPLDFKERLRASGARDYGEDVADRNLALAQSGFGVSGMGTVQQQQQQQHQQNVGWRKSSMIGMPPTMSTATGVRTLRSQSVSSASVGGRPSTATAVSMPPSASRTSALFERRRSAITLMNNAPSGLGNGNRKPWHKRSASSLAGGNGVSSTRATHRSSSSMAGGRTTGLSAPTVRRNTLQHQPYWAQPGYGEGDPHLRPATSHAAGHTRIWDRDAFQPRRKSADNAVEDDDANLPSPIRSRLPRMRGWSTSSAALTTSSDAATTVTSSAESTNSSLSIHHNGPYPSSLRPGSRQTTSTAATSAVDLTASAVSLLLKPLDACTPRKPSPKLPQNKDDDFNIDEAVSSDAESFTTVSSSSDGGSDHSSVLSLEYTLTAATGTTQRCSSTDSRPRERQKRWRRRESRRRPTAEGEEDLLFKEGYGPGGMQLPGLEDLVRKSPAPNGLGPVLMQNGGARGSLCLPGREEFGFPEVREVEVSEENGMQDGIESDSDDQEDIMANDELLGRYFRQAAMVLKAKKGRYVLDTAADSEVEEENQVRDGDDGYAEEEEEEDARLARLRQRALERVSRLAVERRLSAICVPDEVDGVDVKGKGKGKELPLREDRAEAQPKIEVDSKEQAIDRKPVAKAESDVLTLVRMRKDAKRARRMAGETSVPAARLQRLRGQAVVGVSC
ncbi:uncharacterized protein CTHT_0032890 [Thermochaetoides thermophila DSM 1495]|uniref:Uncharacterized protein n=1 Tax=Chaetomium thermophilum (strain DSM 1495 / CBS 144.50 / IMI 039719) TaxID=759272 RepID=G0S5G6_CHATD|nr:hypothetical protein CTHT_0032890 [Thermochaetoides thermophila DSM 1495]EGS21431.1 hypothetical protein CTHT_0032890 [Thermochaetoides thermophila DSM 1495]